MLRVENHFFWRYPRLLLAACGVVLIPALYVLIYLASVWDPASKTGALPVGLVNLDEGLVYRQQAFNVGEDLISRIKSKSSFGYRDLDDEATARALVEAGQLAFALIVPNDFSFNAVPGSQPGAGRLVVFSSEGNNYTSANLARHFAEDLGREVNQSLNEQRWTLVLAEASGSQRSLLRLHEGVEKLLAGSAELAAGAGTAAQAARALTAGAAALDQGVDSLLGGTRSLSSGLRSMHAQRPRNSELRSLDEGSKALAQGQRAMLEGIAGLQRGVDELQAGVTRFKSQAAESAFVPEAVSTALDQIGAGVAQLDAGARVLDEGQQKLVQGAANLAGGVSRLTEGTRAAKSALGEVVKQLPADARLEQLAQGSEQLKASAALLQKATQALAEGARHLNGGLALLGGSLPAAPSLTDGNPQGLANSVLPVVEISAPVRNNGSGFAPNIIPGALWLGASLIAFLFQLRALPRAAVHASALAKMAAKVTLPLMLVLVQALMVWLCMRYVLEMRSVDRLGMVSTLCVASATFLLLIYALTRSLGDLGKALALILLAIQLSSSGGLLPVELSGGVFAAISDYLPITWVVKAVKASLFGAFGGDWMSPLRLIMGVAVASALVATFVGRWRFVPIAQLRPRLDV